MLLIAAFTFGESYEFDGDIWTFSNTVEDDGQIATFWIHDLEYSEWNSIDPEEWGLLQTVIGIGRDSKTGESMLIFMYKTSVEYYLPHYIIGSDENYDSYLLGGQSSNGDYSDIVEEDGIYTSSILINLTEKDIKYLDRDRYFVVTDSNNGYDIYFGIPEEIFNVSFDVAGIKEK